MLYSVPGRVECPPRPGVARPLDRWSDGGRDEEELKLTALNALPTAAFTLAQNLSTRGLQGWIQDNIVPLVLLGIAIILLWIGGRGDNAGVARRSVGLIVGLVALGIAVSGSGPQVGTFLAKLITG